MDRIDQMLDEIEHLNSLSGDAYVAEAARLGMVVTERGTFADPNHPAREFLTMAENKELIERRFARHGITLDLAAEPQTHDA